MFLLFMRNKPDLLGVGWWVLCKCGLIGEVNTCLQTKHAKYMTHIIHSQTNSSAFIHSSRQIFIYKCHTNVYTQHTQRTIFCYFLELYTSTNCFFATHICNLHLIWCCTSVIAIDVLCERDVNINCRLFGCKGKIMKILECYLYSSV